jgi:hypothetical protein
MVLGESTCVFWFMVVLGKHPLCLEMIVSAWMTVSPWKALVVLVNLW